MFRGAFLRIQKIRILRSVAAVKEFKHFLVVIHCLIRPFENRFKSPIGGRAFRNAHRSGIPQPGVLIRLLKSILKYGPESLNVLMPCCIILSAQYNDKFVAADAENRRMLESIAYQLTAALDINVAFLVTVLIVDLLQIVNITMTTANSTGPFSSS